MVQGKGYRKIVVWSKGKCELLYFNLGFDNVNYRLHIVLAHSCRPGITRFNSYSITNNCLRHRGTYIAETTASLGRSTSLFIDLSTWPPG